MIGAPFASQFAHPMTAATGGSALVAATDGFNSKYSALYSRYRISGTMVRTRRPIIVVG